MKKRISVLILVVTMVAQLFGATTLSFGAEGGWTLASTTNGVYTYNHSEFDNNIVGEGSVWLPQIYTTADHKVDTSFTKLKVTGDFTVEASTELRMYSNGGSGTSLGAISVSSNGAKEFEVFVPTGTTEINFEVKNLDSSTKTVQISNLQAKVWYESGQGLVKFDDWDIHGNFEDEPKFVAVNDGFNFRFYEEYGTTKANLPYYIVDSEFINYSTGFSNALSTIYRMAGDDSVTRHCTTPDYLEIERDGHDFSIDKFKFLYFSYTSCTVKVEGFTSDGQTLTIEQSVPKYTAGIAGDEVVVLNWGSVNKIRIWVSNAGQIDGGKAYAVNRFVIGAPYEALGGTATINGTMTYGEQLTVDTSTITNYDADGSYSYTWYRIDGDEVTEISGATSSTYTLGNSDIDKKIKVEVTATRNAGSIMSSETEVIGKAVSNPTIGITPVAINANIAEDAITLNTVDGYEYSIDNGTNWQDSPIFEGLEADASYTFVQRLVETDISEASEKSDSLTVSTLKEALTGSVTIDNMTPQFGDTLTVSLTNDNNTGILHYDWIIGEVSTGIDNEQYTVDQEDIGKTIKVVITSDVERESLTSAETSSVVRADYSDPVDNIVVVNTDHYRISLSPVNGYEYSVDNGQNWQDATLFEGLKWSTEYTVVQRAKQTETHEASDVSESMAVTTAATEDLTGTVSIDNTTPTVGDILTTSITGHNSTSDIFTYQWYCDGSLIEGAIDSTYIVKSIDYGKTISVKIKSDDRSSECTSAKTTAVEAIVYIATDNQPVDIVAPGTYVIKGDGSRVDNMTINVGPLIPDVTIILDNVNIHNTNIMESTMNIGFGTAVKLLLISDNVIKDDGPDASIYLEGPAQIEIESEPMGSLYVNYIEVGVTDIKSGLIVFETGVGSGGPLNLNVIGGSVKIQNDNFMDTDVISYTDVIPTEGLRIFVDGNYYTTMYKKHANDNNFYIITNGVAKAEFIGIADITGTNAYGEELTAVINTENSDTNSFTYKWYRNDVEIVDETSSSYTLTADDIEKTIKVQIASTDREGTILATAQETVTKGSASEVKGIKPVLNVKTKTNITIDEVDGYEYQLVISGEALEEDSWGGSGNFTGLTENTTYDIYQRVKETTTNNASLISEILTVTTEASSTGNNNTSNNSGSSNKGTTSRSTTDSNSNTEGDGAEPAPKSVPVKPTISSDGGTNKAFVDVTSVEAGIKKAAEAEANGEKASIEISFESNSDESDSGTTGDEGNEGELNQKINGLEVLVPQEAFNNIAKNTDANVKINHDMIKLEFDSKAVDAINGAESKGDVTISVEKVDPSTLSPEAQKMLADSDAPVFDFTVSKGEATTSSFGEGSVKVSMPYTPKEGQDQSALVIYYVNEQGGLEQMQGVYNKETGNIDFVTDHFSKYIIGYNLIDFTDVEEGVWYQEAITGIAAREIVKGIGNDIFNPDGMITRAEFITIVIRYFEFESLDGSNYVDVMEGDWYYDYIRIAKAKNILPEMYGTACEPNKAIVREEMMYILYKSLEADQKIFALPDNGDRLADFEDSKDVSSYAVEGSDYLISRDIINGVSETQFTPTATSTRAEVVQMIWNMIKLMQ